MIEPYEFDNANVDGDKEAVIVPNPPTLINKLSANETNNIKDKLNEVIGATNLGGSPIEYLDLRLWAKGESGGTPNTLPTLQVGDRVHGFADATTMWLDAIYLGGDPTDRDNYTPVGSPSPVPQILDGFIGVTPGFAVGQQTFTLPAGAKCVGVYLAHAKQYKATPNNGSLVNTWSQTGDDVLLEKIPVANNYLYIEFIL